MSVSDWEVEIAADEAALKSKLNALRSAGTGIEDIIFHSGVGFAVTYLRPINNFGMSSSMLFDINSDFYHPWTASGSPINMGFEADYPSFTPLSTGGFAAAYEKGVGNSSYIKTYDSAGTEVVAEKLFATNIDVYPGIATLGNGNIVLTWKDSGDSNKGKFIIYDTSLNIVKAETVFDTVTATRGPIVIPQSDGGFFICHATSNDNFQVRVFNAAGVEQTSPSVVSMDLYAMYCNGVPLPGGGAIVAYTDSSVYDVGYMVLDADGEVTVTKFGLTGDCCDHPTVALLGNGDIFLGFYDDCDSGDSAMLIYDGVTHTESFAKFDMGSDIYFPKSAITLDDGRVMFLSVGGTGNYWKFQIITSTGVVHQKTIIKLAPQPIGGINCGLTQLDGGNVIVGIPDGTANIGYFDILSAP